MIINITNGKTPNTGNKNNAITPIEMIIFFEIIINGVLLHSYNIL